MYPTGDRRRPRPRCARAGLVLLLAVTAAGAAAAHAQVFDIYKNVDWFFLAKYDYNPEENFEVTPMKTTGTIPADILAMNGQKMMIYGILTPLDFQAGYATKFIFIATIDVCGFGSTPRINEWMDVEMVPGKKARIQAAPGLAPEGTVFGTFTVKEELDEDGRVLSLYHMVADKIE